MPTTSADSTARLWGGLICAKRHALGWDQGRLAAEMRTTQPTVSRWETGRQLPSIERQRRLMDLLGIAPDEVAEAIYGRTA